MNFSDVHIGNHLDSYGVLGKEPAKIRASTFKQLDVEKGRLMVEKKRRFRSVMPLYQKSTHVVSETVDPFRVVSILKLSQGPLQKEDLMQMLETSIEEVERAVTLLAGRGIIRVDPGEKPEKDMVTL